MLAGMPFFLGLAGSAHSAVSVILGAKWAQTAPVITLLGFAMPFMTLQVILGPTMNALGRPGIYLRLSVIGALLLPLAFLVGVQWGVSGIAAAWIVGYPILVALSMRWALPIVGVSVRDFVSAVGAPVLAALEPERPAKRRASEPHTPKKLAAEGKTLAKRPRRSETEEPKPKTRFVPQDQLNKNGKPMRPGTKKTTSGSHGIPRRAGSALSLRAGARSGTSRKSSPKR